MQVFIFLEKSRKISRIITNKKLITVMAKQRLTKVR